MKLCFALIFSAVRGSKSPSPLWVGSASLPAPARSTSWPTPWLRSCILPGGIPGVPNLKADATVRQVCTDFAAAGKKVCAICAAPTALAAFGVLQGKKATVYPGMDADLTAARAAYTGLPLTIDGNIITGEALGAAIPFALAIARELAGADAAARVKKAIVYQ